MIYGKIKVVDHMQTAKMIHEQLWRTPDPHIGRRRRVEEIKRIVIALPFACCWELHFENAPWPEVANFECTDKEETNDAVSVWEVICSAFKATSGCSGE